jgi:hypothetical protein
MQASLKKTLYLGLAALSFGAVAAVSSTASAKSYATMGAYKTLTTDATKRNVEATGTNALYTKPGTVKGAKVVASKTTLKTLATSKKSADYFRAYGVRTTNRGSVYYRVVTMNGKYRGYIYGGKSDTAFAGGIKAANTTTTAPMPARTTGYYLKDVTKNTLWTAPQYTQYKAKKVSLYGAKSTDTFKVDQAVTKTREGSLYYHVTDENNSAVSGWIFAGQGYVANTATQNLGGLSLTMSDAAATADNSVKVVYRDDSGTTVGSSTWITANSGTTAGSSVNAGDKNAAGVTLSDFVNNSVPSGYTTNGTVDTSAAQYGNTVYVNVEAAATSKIQMVADTVTNTASTATNPVAGLLSAGDKLYASDLSATLSETGVKALTGDKGTQIGATNLGTISSAITATSVSGDKTYYAADGTPFHYVFSYEPTNFASDNRLANYGDTLKASFSATLTEGAATVTSSDTSWIA